jgi:hypothetical protein
LLPFLIAGKKRLPQWFLFLALLVGDIFCKILDISSAFLQVSPQLQNADATE